VSKGKISAFRPKVSGIEGKSSGSEAEILMI